MSECRKDEMELELCLQCRLDMLRDGRGVRSLSCATERRAACGVCGKKRYVGRYGVTKGVNT